VQLDFCCVNVINRSWRTQNRNQITRTKEKKRKSNASTSMQHTSMQHEFWSLGAGSHGVPTPKSPSHLRSIRVILTVESIEIGTYHFTRVPSPTFQIWHGCLHDNTFLEVRLGTCVENWAEQKAPPQLSTQVPCNIFATNNQDPTFLTVNHIFKWFLEAQELGRLPPWWGLANNGGDLGPHVNRH
jgi:hypothetical protein